MYKTGLIIGRFQPFHNGHLYLFKEAFKIVNTAIIGIGSVNVHNEDNPFSQQQVEKMLQAVLEHTGCNDHLIQTLGIPDFHDDEKCLDHIITNARPFDVVISHNDWVIGIFEKANMPVIAIPFYKRELYEGVKIRELMKQGDDWIKRVPDYVAEIITESVDGVGH